WLADGNIEYLGRLDFQVKVRGLRIELGEIESALERHPQVRQAVVVVREDSPGDKRLVAYLVSPASQQPLSAADVRDFLKQQLPEYMLPAAFVLLETLPLTSSGKVDRKALPTPDGALTASVEYVAPRNETEQKLAALWSEVLRVERVGVHDNFFELGGHSLLVTQVVSRIRASFGVELSLPTVFEASTLDALARAIKAGARTAHGLLLPPPRPVERTGALPLSFAQQRLWFLDQLVPDSALYNMPTPLRLEGTLDTAALARSLTELVRRHEVLRTSFPAEAGNPLQVIASPASLPLERMDLSALPLDEREAEARRLIEAEVRKPFSLAHGPMLRALLLKLDERQHVLVLNLHHIVSDGWSMGVLVREVAALYEAFSQGLPSPLPELSLQYADFAAWQRQWLQGEALEAQFAYWRQQLANAPQVLELPTDRPRPAVQSYRGATLAHLMPRALSQSLQALCQREGVTSFMALLAGFQSLLSRYSGQTDIVVGTDIAGRTHADTEGLIGFFVNQLVMRGDLSGDPTFRELLGRTRQVALGAYAHQDVPFEELVRVLNPERSLAHAPIFQVKLVQQNVPTAELTLPGLVLRGVEGDTGSAKFDLTLSINETSEGLACLCDYSTDLFEAGTLARLMEHLQVLLETAVATPDTRLSALPLLTETERQRMLVAWNDTATEFPADTCIHHFFEAQAQRTPDAHALGFEGTWLSYRELDARSNQLAWHLRALGVGPEVRVGLCAERSLELIVGLFAILKAGGAYVPLDPSYPRERLEGMLEDARPAVLLVQPALLNQLPESPSATVVPLLLEDASLRTLPAYAPVSLATSDTLAYVLFTSGSTGRPKGVQVPHRTVSNFFTGMDARVLRPQHGTWLAVTRLSFDISVLELLWTLARGFRVVLQSDTRDPAWLAHAVRQDAVTHLQCTPSLARALLLDADSADALRSLQQLLVGGEALSAELARELRLRVPSVLNMYGPTETTVWSSSFSVPQDTSALIPLGQPIANTALYVLDSHLHPVPSGVPGELFIGGEGVVRGYLGRPHLTAERFLPDPFASSPGARLYRTGDKARRLADGSLEYLGRLDFQVKLRGFRIELGEIEALLRELPSVREALVVLREDVPGDKRLVAYVVSPTGAQAPSASDARDFLKQQLPEYMVPSAVVALEALPLTFNGKLDRKALPPPGLQGLDDSGAYLAPRTPTQQLLASQWSLLLGVARVGARDNFFELGGHSLLATQVISRIRATFGVDLPISALFESPSLESLATSIDALARKGLGPKLPSLRRVDRASAPPLSFAQQRLWFLDQLIPDSALYNMPAPLRLEGTLDTEALEQSLTELVRRHEVLRTSFPAEAVQRIAPPAPLPLECVDLSALPLDEREDEARRLIEAEVRKPFSLAHGPMLRALLLKLDEQQHVLVLNLHHIVSDGWSMGVLVREVAALYEAFSQGRPSPLPELPVQYADFAAWQRQWLQGEALEAQFAYWRQQLAGAPQVLELPTDRPRPAVQSYRGATLAHLMPKALSQSLQALCQREGVTSFMALLAGFQSLLARYSGQTDIIVGTDIAGRTHADTEGLIGFFVNQLVMRGDLSGDPTFRELLGRTRQVALGAYAHQDIPFEELVRVLNPERSLAHAPIFQVKLVLQNAPAAELHVPGLTFRAEENSTGAAKFDLTLFIDETPEGLALLCDYSTDLYEAGTLARLMEHLQVLLETAVATPDTRLSALPLLTETERHQVLVAWNDTTTEFSSDTCIHHLFEAQVQRTPDAPALGFEGDSLSYRELDARSNQLAHHLRTLGVGPEVRVGLCAERSLELVVGLFAILKAGGAYVPLDPSYPRERLEWMLEDSRPAVLLAQPSLLTRLPESAGATVVPLVLNDEALRALPTHAPVSLSSP
ncbi:amino acid adenylation domain-containing protein, partial [Corallococcus sp. ZKHCc1 1396]